MNKIIQYLKTSSFKRNIIAIIVTFLIVLFLLFYSLRFYTRHGQTMAVPNLKGLSLNEALNTLDEQGFKSKIDSVYQVDAPPGTVIEQDPDVGTQVKSDRTIYLTIITREAPEVKIPELHDMAFLEAQSLINNYGLKIGDTTYRSDIARDRILSATINGKTVHAGDAVPKGSTVNLILGDGRGQSEVSVPSVIGYTLDEARFSLMGASLSIGQIIYSGHVADTANARVILQSPEASMDAQSKVNRGRAIDLTLSEQE